MDQQVQISTENATITMPTLRRSLASQARTLGDPRIFRDPVSLRSQITEMGSAEAIEAELRALVAGPQKATGRDFAVCLGRLALHYWRPDFTADQAKLLYEDFITDLAGVTVDELRDACAEWRRDPLNRFFPRTGELLELVAERISDRARIKSGAEFMLNLISQNDGKDRVVTDAADRLRTLGDRMKAR